MLTKIAENEANWRREIGEPNANCAESTGECRCHHTNPPAISAMATIGRDAIRPAAGLKIRSNARFRTNMETIVSRLTTIAMGRAPGPAAASDLLSWAIAAVLFTSPPKIAV